LSAYALLFDITNEEDDDGDGGILIATSLYTPFIAGSSLDVTNSVPTANKSMATFKSS
jgi:hypothetical protein